MYRSAKVLVWSALVVSLGAVDADAEGCGRNYSPHSSCNPYGAKLLTLDKVRYTDERTPLSKLRHEPRRTFFSVPEWLERYVVIEPPLRFRGTTGHALSRAIDNLKQKVMKASDKITTEQKKGFDEWVGKVKFPWGYYKVQSGDNVSKIARRFKVKISDILRYNRLSKEDILHIGQKLILPISQETIDVISSGRYRIKKGDSLIAVAKRFGLDPNEIASMNRIRKSNDFYAGRVIQLPFEHITKRKWLKSPGRKKLRVIATAYTSHRGQTDDTPFLAAWNNRLRPGMKVIAVSRDLITKYGITNGTKVKISGLPGYYTVRDKMNKRYKRRIDIYMGTDRRRALRWGRRNVLIYW